MERLVRRNGLKLHHLSSHSPSYELERYAANMTLIKIGPDEFRSPTREERRRVHTGKGPAHLRPLRKVAASRRARIGQTG